WPRGCWRVSSPGPRTASWTSARARAPGSPRTPSAATAPRACAAATGEPHPQRVESIRSILRALTRALGYRVGVLRVERAKWVGRPAAGGWHLGATGGCGRLLVDR